MNPLSRFETLFDEAPFSVQLLAADGRTLRVNRAWEALWQADGTGLKEYVLSEYNILTDPQLQAKGITPILRRAFDGEAVALPIIAYDPAELGKPGRMRWLRARALPVRDTDGSVGEVILIHQDVSDQVQAEDEFHHSDLRLKQLANTIPQLAWMAEPDGTIHWYNDRWYAYTGTTPKDMYGWGWQSVHDPDVLPEVMTRWTHALAAGEPFQMTFPLRGKDGVFRPFFTLVAPLRNEEGRVVQWFGTNTDVSALHEAQASLRATEERLRLAMLAGGIGIWDWEVEADRITWSDEVYQLHGLSRGDFGGRQADLLQLVHPLDRDQLAAKVQAALLRDEQFSAEFRALIPDGSVKWLSTWARVQRDAAGAPLRLVGATISVDAYKRAEAALRDGDRRKDEFLAMLAHELRNPLAPISTAAYLLQSPGTSDEQLDRASAMILRQVRHMTELVDDLLDVSRVTRGLIELDHETVDLNAVVSAAIEQSRPAIEARGHHLTTSLAPDPACVIGDVTRLTQAVVNLLNNAAKYTPDRGSITLSVESLGGDVGVVVSDDGVGIEAELLPHVFELFTQGFRDRSRSEGGLGIGLALVKTIVSLHGGQVSASSAGPGKGCTFTLRLPREVSPQRAPAATSVATADGQAQVLQVMVVDDNRDAADALSMLLGAVGHEVVVRNDAAGAMQALRDEKMPDVVILDIGLPDMDGYALAGRMRQSAPDVTYVALTGYGRAEDRALSQAAGFHHHLVKPVDPELLIDLLAGLGSSARP